MFIFQSNSGANLALVFNSTVALSRFASRPHERNPELCLFGPSPKMCKALIQLAAALTDLFATIRDYRAQHGCAGRITCSPVPTPAEI